MSKVKDRNIRDQYKDHFKHNFRFAYKNGHWYFTTKTTISEQQLDEDGSINSLMIKYGVKT